MPLFRMERQDISDSDSTVPAGLYRFEPGSGLPSGLGSTICVEEEIGWDRFVDSLAGLYGISEEQLAELREARLEVES